ncbi:MAG: hypothetical protein ACMUIP_17345 [bacterium]
MNEKIVRSIFLIIFFCSLGIGVRGGNAQLFPKTPGVATEVHVINPWSGYAYDQVQLRDLFSSSTVIDESAVNLFSTYDSHTEANRDPFSTSFVNTTSTSNLWGKFTQSGNAFYSDPWLTTGGKYMDVTLPTMGLSTDSAFYRNITGAGGSVSSSLDTSWFHFESSLATETEIGSVAGPFGYPLPAQRFEVDSTYASYGKDNIFSFTMHPALAGAVTLRANAPQIGAMDRVLADTPMYTKDGQKFYATTGYYNYANPSHWFFPEEVSTTKASINTVAGQTISGYYAGASVGSNVVRSGITAVPAGYIPSGVGSAPISGRSVVSGVSSGSYSPGSYAPSGGTIYTPAGVPNFSYGYSGREN